MESPQVMGCVHLAVTERREIASRPDARYLFDHALFNDPEAFVTLLCRRDPWAPAALAQLPGARLLPAPVGHAFVVDARQRGLVAEAIHQILVGGARPEVSDRPPFVTEPRTPSHLKAAPSDARSPGIETEDERE